jgi:ribosomal subunit interface protein
MKLIYSGKTKDFTPELEEKIAGKLSKLSKQIEQRGEREAHISHRVVRHLRNICVEVKFYDHNVVAEASNADLETAVCEAVEKLEVQIVKLRHRWRDTHRDPKSVRNSKENWDQPAVEKSSPAVAKAPLAKAQLAKSAAAKSNGSASKKPKVFHVDHQAGRKPMTLDEAILEMEDSDDYVVYRDADRNCLSVLVRRPDGNFDLIQS